ncbi:hypothetical protein GC174_10895 [bacterium]|nr:hypothetical protein [bacterium]
MPQYDYRCQECRKVFTVERSMNESSECSCEHCGSEDVSRIWNMFIRASGVTPDLGQGTTKGGSSRSKSKGGCGSCCATSCANC